MATRLEPPPAPTAGYSAHSPLATAEGFGEPGVSTFRRFLDRAAVAAVAVGLVKMLKLFESKKSVNDVVLPTPAAGPEAVPTSYAPWQGPLAKRALQAVVQHPFLPAPRLDYADLAEEHGDAPRARFIRLQLGQFDREPTGFEARRLRREVDGLLREHGAEWAAPVAKVVSYYHFSRGFVELVSTTADRFLKNGWMLDSAPILHLELSGRAGDAGALLDCELLRRIRSLSLDGWGLGDREAMLLASSPHLEQLRWLSLAGNSIGRDGVQALADSESLPALRFVNLAGNPFDPGARYAHDDGRVVDTWRPDEAYQLALSRRVAWLDLDAPIGDLLPDRFKLADAPVPALETACAA